MIELFATREFSYYQDSLVRAGKKGITLTLTLSADECAAILQAHDYGVTRVTPDAKHHLDLLMSKLKEEIWP